MILRPMGLLLSLEQRSSAVAMKQSDVSAGGALKLGIGIVLIL
jgi:hypothetical protein